MHGLIQRREVNFLEWRTSGRHYCLREVVAQVASGEAEAESFQLASHPEVTFARVLEFARQRVWYDNHESAGPFTFSEAALAPKSYHLFGHGCILCYDLLSALTKEV